MKNAIVTTTIYVPKLLEDYCSRFHENDDDVSFVVVGDKKTPEKTKTYCKKLSKRQGFDIHYFDVKDQKKVFSDQKRLLKYLRYNSIQRRNLAILYAYKEGAEKIVTIDDDNHILDKNYLNHHLTVGEKKKVDVIESSTGWYNVCEALKEKDDQIFFHRGYPIEGRETSPKIQIKKKKVHVCVNAGFWLNDPDIDAICRLNRPVEVTGIKKGFKKGFALGANTWSPFNSQNTALSREIIPGYFLDPYIGRYDDIWASYMIKKMSAHLNQHVTYGQPLVEQKRNPHNYFKDYDMEVKGMQLTSYFCNMLKNIRLRGRNYLDCSVEIVEKAEMAIAKDKNLVADDKKFLGNIMKGYSIWTDTIESL